MLTTFRFRLDRNGFQHFNFRQHLWVNASVRMAFTQAPSTALTTLALNILSLAATAEPSGLAQAGLRRQLRLARKFAQECLLTAPATRWIIRREVVLTWVITQRTTLRTGARHRAIFYHDKNVSES